MATGWMLSTGIYQKMEREVTTSTALKGYFEEAFWVPEHVSVTKPLSLSHLLVVFLIIIVCNFTSFLIFIVELHHSGWGKKKDAPDMRVTDELQMQVHIPLLSLHRL